MREVLKTMNEIEMITNEMDRKSLTKVKWAKPCRFVDNKGHNEFITFSISRNKLSILEFMEYDPDPFLIIEDTYDCPSFPLRNSLRHFLFSEYN